MGEYHPLCPNAVHAERGGAPPMKRSGFSTGGLVTLSSTNSETMIISVPISNATFTTSTLIWSPTANATTA